VGGVGEEGDLVAKFLVALQCGREGRSVAMEVSEEQPLLVSYLSEQLQVQVVQQSIELGARPRPCIGLTGDIVGSGQDLGEQLCVSMLQGARSGVGRRPRRAERHGFGHHASPFGPDPVIA
jgi:hypothetical protein